MIIVDGQQAYKLFSPSSGPVNVALRWFAEDSRQEEKPAMFIYPKPHVKREKAGAFVIPLSLAYQYQDLDLSSRSDLTTIMSAARDAALAMKLDPDKYTITSICDAIFNYLPELIAMPPKRMVITEKAEQADQESIGEMAIKLDGKTIAEREVFVP